MSTSEANAEHISQGKKKIYQLENDVLYNKAMVILTREAILENRAGILKNYEAAFNGNRQLANANTEAIFRNRYAIIKNADATDPVHVNFREIQANKAKLDFLDRRSILNGQVTEISKDMAEINTQLIALNEKIRKITVGIIETNQKDIADNSALINNHGKPEGWDHANAESNANLIKANQETIAKIRTRADANAVSNNEVYATVKANKERIEENTKEIYKRRSEILANRQAIETNVKNASAHIIH